MASLDKGSSPHLRHALLTFSIALYLVYSSFGFAHPVLWGHFGFHTAAYLTRALVSLRFGYVVPADSPGFAPPSPNTVYLHHPFAYHHIYTLLIAIIGNHAWLGAVIPALTGLGLAWALHALVRRFWGAWPAALAVLIWVCLPFIWTFSILTDPMFPAMTCSIVTTCAFVRFVETPSWRWMGIGALATAVGGVLMWEALMQTALYGGLCFFWLVFHRRVRLGRFHPAIVWTFVTGIVIILTLAIHAAFIFKHGRAADFVESFRVRREIDYKGAFETIGKRALILYGPALGALTGLWLALFVRRAILRRARLRDIAVVTFLAINVVYILLFPQAAAVHLYRVFWTSSSLVLVVVDLAVTVYEDLVARRLAGKPGFSPAGTTTFVVVGWLALILPQSFHDLVESRAVMGCLDNDSYDADEEKLAFASEVNRLTTPADVVGIAKNIDYRDEFFYRLDRTIRDVDTLSDVDKLENGDVTVAVTTAEPSDYRDRTMIRRLAAAHPSRRIGGFYFFDLRRGGAEARVFEFRPRPVSLAWWWFVSHVHPPLELVESHATAKAR
jgi:hypothetical protein